MRSKDKVLAAVEAILWYAMTYYILYSIKNEVSLYQSAFIILALGYLAAWACPLIRHSDSWKRTFGSRDEKTTS